MANKALRLIAILCVLTLGVPAFGQSVADYKARIETQKVRNDIHWGEASASTPDGARERAIENMTLKIKSVVKSGASLNLSNSANGAGDEDFSSNYERSTFAVIENLKEICYEETNSKTQYTKYTCFVYITDKDYKKIQQDRNTEELDLINAGIEMEQQVNLAGALRNYTWAHTVIKAFNDTDLKVEVNGRKLTAYSWLAQKIESILTNLKFEINENSVTDFGVGSDKYSVTVNTTYNGYPVSSLDVSYDNTEAMQSTLATDGNLILSYPTLDGLKSLTFNIQYGYAADAKTQNGIIEAAYSGMSADRRLNLNCSRKEIPFKYNAGKNKAKRTSLDTSNDKVFAQSVLPDVKPEREALDRSQVAAPTNMTVAESCIERMRSVEVALKTKKYEPVHDLFTPEGWKIFSLLTSKSKISVTGKADYNIEETPLFLRGTAIPIKVSRGGKSASERLVFRFDKDTGRISSVAFALTHRAESDIFRAQGSWQLDSRYSILTFMEDYQTAFHTQELSYIEKIFSENAIIITGMFTDGNSGHFEDDVLKSRGANKRGKRVVYKTQTKSEYLKNLKRCFDNNNWTHIDFEDTEIRKIPTSMADNDVMWIELKQTWKSSGYCDTGFLALQINLVPSGSKINVRTWTPDFVEIEELNKRFPVDVY